MWAGCCCADPMCLQDRGEGLLQRAGCSPRGQTDPGSRFGEVTLGGSGLSLWGLHPPKYPRGEVFCPLTLGPPKVSLVEGPLPIHIWGDEGGGRKVSAALHHRAAGDGVSIATGGFKNGNSQWEMSFPCPAAALTPQALSVSKGQAGQVGAMFVPGPP